MADGESHKRIGAATNGIYWANALFCEADRTFNAQCVRRLREVGYDVFLPQESPVNKDTSPSATEIFRVDTSTILNSNLVIACLDQETIDSGVACEIGIAFAFGIPIIGLYTDIRQFRDGPGRMYKNLYTLGAVESFGEIVTSLDGLLEALPIYLKLPTQSLPPASPAPTVLKHYSVIADKYEEFVQRLESWYSPPWTPIHSIKRWMEILHPASVLDIGCGPGSLGSQLSAEHSAVSFLGYDPSLSMAAISRERHESHRCHYTSDACEVSSLAAKTPFDLALALFSLHDHPSQTETLHWTTECLRPGGHVGIIDLSTEDLPTLTDQLRRGLARPAVCQDSRFSTATIVTLAKECDLEIVKCELALPRITFSTARDLLQYLETFGIYDGMDLPLGLKTADRELTRHFVERLSGTWTFPYCDQRVFVSCLLRKR